MALTSEAADQLVNDLKIIEDYIRNEAEVVRLVRNATSGLRNLAESSKKIDKDVRIADTVGSAAGIGGSLLTIGGLIAAPFTGGASLAVVFWGGTGLAAAGGITSLGANITKVVDTKNKEGAAKELLTKVEAELTDVYARQQSCLCAVERVLNLPEIREYLQKLMSLYNADETTLKEKMAEMNDPIVLIILDEILKQLPKNLGDALRGVLVECLPAFKLCIKFASNPRVRQSLGKLVAGAGVIPALPTPRGATTNAAGTVASETAAAGLSTTARVVGGTLAAVAVVVNIVNIARIWTEERAPTAAKLNKMAVELEGFVRDFPVA